jgi:hypothetical protein
VAVAVVAAIVLATGSGGAQPPRAFTTTQPAARVTFPAPPAHAVVFSREDGGDLLALAVVARSGGIGLQVSDVGEEGTGVRGLGVSFAAHAGDATRTATATVCGAGCYASSVELAGTPGSVDVTVRRTARTTRWHVALPRPWPARDASAIVARASRVWRALSDLTYHEDLGSDATHVLHSTWHETAPDRLTYDIVGGGNAVIIGTRRWDRPSGDAKWQESEAERLTQPIPFWVEATDAHVVGTGTVSGRRVFEVSFYDPRTPGWFLISVDRATGRTLDVRMDAAAHFMHDTYSRFDVANSIRPPASNP